MFEIVKQYKLTISVILLVIFYGVGIGGVAFSDDPVGFLKLTPVNLMISAVILLFHHQKWNRGLITSLIVVSVLGFAVEVIGVKTGKIFGDYAYGETLGYKLFDVPLLIGLNWLMLCYFSVFTFLKHIKNKWVVGICAGLSIVVLDYLIEPVAIAFDFWDWNEHSIPLQNYIAWMALGVVFCWFIAFSAKNSANKIAPYLFVIQILFFGILNMMIQ